MRKLIAGLAGCALIAGLLAGAPVAAHAAPAPFRVSITKIADKSVPLAWDLVVSGKVAQRAQAKKAKVTVQASSNGTSWKTLKTVKLGAKATFSKVKVPTGKLAVGTWRLRVCKAAGKGYAAGCSTPTMVTIQKKPAFKASVTRIADKSVTLGENLVVSGKVTPAAQAKKDKVTIQASSNGTSWKTLKTVKLDSKATFSKVKVPTSKLSAGTWQVRLCKGAETRYATGCSPVVKVTVTPTKKTTTLAYKTITRSDATLPAGTTKVIRNGKNGSRVDYYRKGSVYKSVTTADPVDKIVAKGTKATSNGTFNRAYATEFIKRLNAVRATGYTCRYTGSVMPATTQLPTDTYATQAAEGHAKDMVDRNYFSHTTQGTGESPYTRLERILPAGKFIDLLGENLLGGPATPSVALDYFLASDTGHCEWLLDPQVNAVGAASYSNSGSPMGGAWVVELPAYAE